jgi:hypothetical protein
MTSIRVQAYSEDRDCFLSMNDIPDIAVRHRPGIAHMGCWSRCLFDGHRSDLRADVLLKLVSPEILKCQAETQYQGGGP